MSNETDQIKHEQSRVDEIFTHFDEKHQATYDKLERLVRGEHYDETQKSDFIAASERELIRLESAENKLVFGKMLAKDSEYYIGRIGLQSDEKQVLIDWRSKMGELFYRATISDNQGVALRRHINLDMRDVVSLDDDVLDHNAVDESTVIVGDGALINALERRRTGEMHDIVSTIQKEQDMIIRTPFTKRLIIQGTPGTGKTVVALHRIAYLLYQYSQQMNEHPVLFVGPSRRFITYVGKVLPSLGESGVEHRTIEDLVTSKFELPPLRTSSNTEARIKGDQIMKQVLKLALEQFTNITRETVSVNTPSASYRISPQIISSLQSKAKQKSTVYLKARSIFIDSLLDYMVTDGIVQVGAKNPNSSDMLDILRTQLKSFTPFKKLVNMLWMPLTPTFFVQQLFTNPRRLIAAFGKLIPASDTEFLLKLVDSDEIYIKTDASPEASGKPQYAFSDADLPLIDYADYLINGNKPKVAKVNADLIREAEDVLENVAWTVKDTVTAEELADRFGGAMSYTDDYFKKYSHICVDEAQELSVMQWEMLKRRSLYESWTIVGDVLQTYSAAGTHNWHKMNDIIGDTELVELSINYRNPTQIAEYADTVARKYGLRTPQNVTCPRSRPNSVVELPLPTHLPTHLSANGDTITEATAYEVATEVISNAVAQSKDGLTVIICERGTLFDALNACIIRDDAEVELLRPVDAKGLEFDNVLVVNPSGIAAVSPSNLYVASTRATRLLTVYG